MTIEAEGLLKAGPGVDEYERREAGLVPGLDGREGGALGPPHHHHLQGAREKISQLISIDLN